MWWLSLACVLENEVGGKDEPAGTEDSTGVDSEGMVDTSAFTEPEPCNGRDDDGDGAIDEDSADWDGDGIADCVDESCDVEVPEPRSETRAGCSGGSGGGDPGDAQILWRWEANNLAYAMPVVGDVDGDGSPEVVSSDGPDTNSACDLVVLDGATGVEEQRIIGGTRCWGGVSLADVDGDGVPEIITVQGDYTLAALSATGSSLWTSATSDQLVYPLVADLDGDTTPEIVADDWVFDGISGASLSQWYAGPAMYPDVVPIDLEGDGMLEIGSAQGAYTPAGRRVVACSARSTYGLSAPVQLDTDAGTELVTTGAAAVEACDDDGTLLWSSPIEISVTAGALSAGNFDGDDMSEIVVPDRARLILFDNDGTELWSVAHGDTSGANGAALWDIDADGVPELVYTDQTDFHIFSGLDGSELFSHADHQSQTPYNTPTIADVDGDGDGEILFNSDAALDGSQGFAGVTALHDPAHQWPAAPAYYPGQAWDSVTLDDTLSVVTAPDPWWSLPGGVFRGQPVDQGAARPNLAVSVHDVCFSHCDDGYARVSVQVWNDGGADAPAGSKLVLFSSPAGVEGEVLTADLPAIPAATSVEYTYGVLASELGGEVRAVVEPATADCHDDDDVDSYGDLECE